MEIQDTFERYEVKYMLTEQQKRALLCVSAPYMQEDQYGKTTIRNVYYDTENYRLIRRSLEKPVYKEKLRMRSYRTAAEEETVFLELKKKYLDKVYKRRTQLIQREAMEQIRNGGSLGEDQIEKEIGYFISFYRDLQPKACIFYERTAYAPLEGGSFRFTLDENIRYRTDRFTLADAPTGTVIQEDGTYLLEIKTADAIPVWMSRFLTENRIYRTSFSKYGEAYRIMTEKRALTC